MKVYLKSDVECTVDGVGLLKPGEEVEVDLDDFEMYHHTTPAEANFPNTVTVTYDTAEDAVTLAEGELRDDNPPSVNIGSGNDQESYQGEDEEA